MTVHSTPALGRITVTSIEDGTRLSIREKDIVEIHEITDPDATYLNIIMENGKVFSIKELYSTTMELLSKAIN